ncbi:hypothetical protein ACFX15_018843 [Malus domestica]
MKSPLTSFPVIAAIELYHYKPWDLPGKISPKFSSKSNFEIKIWGCTDFFISMYFFDARRRERVVFLYAKEPEVQERFDAEQGGRKWLVVRERMQEVDWASEIAGVQRPLVFKIGKRPGGEKTNWLMDEYSLAAGNRPTEKKKGQWVH